jgi:5,10-methenyltetrahydrofolate synthetase
MKKPGTKSETAAENATPREYASPPCYAHELASPEEAREPPASWAEIRTWRKLTRDKLLSDRIAMTVHARALRAQEAKRRLESNVDLRRYHTLGVYWPMRGEMDVRDIARKHIAAGGAIGLPVVVERSAPVEFWAWRPGMKMQRGIWNIPIPAERVVLVPDALIIPLVGYDGQRYRLGYGGGYYDRTLAVAPRRPLCIGLGFSEGHLPTIYPQPHDIPMDLIITDRILLKAAAA